MLEQSVPDFAQILCTEPVAEDPSVFTPHRNNEGFKTSGQVQYVAKGGNFRKDGYSYTGALQILKLILSYDYLWTNIRVKGGAYGCMSAFKRTGKAYLVSYRDPNLDKTLAVFDGTPEYLRNFSADEHEMTKYIIGTISGLDTPLTPQGRECCPSMRSSPGSQRKLCRKKEMRSWVPKRAISGIWRIS